jgi:hypothetical protein
MGKEINEVFQEKGGVYDVAFLTTDMKVMLRRCVYIGRDEHDQPILQDMDPLSRIPSGPIVTMGAKKVEP